MKFWGEKLVDFSVTICAVLIGGYFALQSSIATDVWNKKTEKVAALAETQKDYLILINDYSSWLLDNSIIYVEMPNLKNDIEKDVMYLRTMRAGTFDNYLEVLDDLDKSVRLRINHSGNDSLDARVDSLVGLIEIQMISIRRSIYNQNPLNLCKKYDDELYQH